MYVTLTDGQKGWFKYIVRQNGLFPDSAKLSVCGVNTTYASHARSGRVVKERQVKFKPREVSDGHMIDGKATNDSSQGQHHNQSQETPFHGVSSKGEICALFPDGKRKWVPYRFQKGFFPNSAILCVDGNDTSYSSHTRQRRLVYEADVRWRLRMASPHTDGPAPAAPAVATAALSGPTTVFPIGDAVPPARGGGHSLLAGIRRATPHPSPITPAAHSWTSTRSDTEAECLGQARPPPRKRQRTAQLPQPPGTTQRAQQAQTLSSGWSKNAGAFLAGRAASRREAEVRDMAIFHERARNRWMQEQQDMLHAQNISQQEVRHVLSL